MGLQDGRDSPVHPVYPIRLPLRLRSGLRLIQGETLTLWVDGMVHDTKTDPNYAKNLFGSGLDYRTIGIVYGSGQSDWPFAMADLRAYDRALKDEEITELSA